MKIIKLFNNKTGKMALSAMQAVGLSAAVGVAGIAAWQMLGSSSQPSLNTVFSSADEDVVFVAGAAGGGSYGGNYGVGGEVQSGIRATLSKDMQLMQADAARTQQQANTPAFVQQEQKISAYKMDGAPVGGLGMDGGNAAKELGVGAGGDMSAIQSQIAALQASVQAQQNAAAQASGTAAGDVAQAAAAAAGARSSFGMAQDMARAAGSNLSSTPLQAGQRVGAEGSVVSASGVLGGAQIAGAAGSSATQGLQGGRRSTSSFGQALAWGGADSKEQLAFLQKQSADTTRNRDRAANEGTKAFMASERLSGGIHLDGETLTTGGASSSDFNMDAETTLGSLGAAGAALEEEISAYEQAKQQLSDDIKSYRNKLATSCGFLPFICQTWVWKMRNNARDKVSKFEEQWGETSYMQTDTRGNLANDARTVIQKIYNRGWGGTIASLTAMYNGEFGKEGDHVFGRQSD